jgi:uncharacterized membrane protein YhaH (DUF805 family)
MLANKIVLRQTKVTKFYREKNMEWMLMPLKKYADFNGRARRMEYWMFYLFSIIVLFAMIAIGALLGGVMGAFDGSEPPAAFLGIGGVLLLIYLAVFLIPAIAVSVRRWHDQDKTGWMVLLFIVLGAIPFIGWIASIANIVFMALPGTQGPNKYGDDPLGGSGAAPLI